MTFDPLHRAPTQMTHDQRTDDDEKQVRGTSSSFSELQEQQQQITSAIKLTLSMKTGRAPKK